MPYDQFPGTANLLQCILTRSEDKPYPPFASGCGFVFSRDLVEYLVEQTPHLKHYRYKLDELTWTRLDTAFGSWIEPINKDIIIENDERIRPYRALPLFHPDTVVQHYMRYTPVWHKILVDLRNTKAFGTKQ